MSGFYIFHTTATGQTVTRLQIYTDKVMTEHEMGPSHPEAPARLIKLQQLFDGNAYKNVPVITPPEAEISWLRYGHELSYIHDVQDRIPDQGYTPLDGDTLLCPASWDAAVLAAGAACQAAADVLDDKCDTAFCATRPPGHHALPNRAMGFCLFNNVFLGARHAQETGKAAKVAIVDFDVHHGNGTDDMARMAENIFFISSHQYPFWPGSGDGTDNIPNKILNIPLAAGTDGPAFRSIYEDQVFPALND